MTRQWVAEQAPAAPARAGGVIPDLLQRRAMELGVEPDDVRLSTCPGRRRRPGGFGGTGMGPGAKAGAGDGGIRPQALAGGRRRRRGGRRHRRTCVGRRPSPRHAHLRRLGRRAHGHAAAAPRPTVGLHVGSVLRREPRGGPHGGCLRRDGYGHRPAPGGVRPGQRLGRLGAVVRRSAHRGRPCRPSRRPGLVGVAAGLRVALAQAGGHVHGGPGAVAVRPGGLGPPAQRGRAVAPHDVDGRALWPGFLVQPDVASDHGAGRPVVWAGVVACPAPRTGTALWRRRRRVPRHRLRRHPRLVERRRARGDWAARGRASPAGAVLHHRGTHRPRRRASRAR